jgi:hypothetical protein
MTNDEQAKTYGKIVARTWADEGFKARLMADPAAVLAAEGFDLPQGVSFKVVEDTDKLITIVLPTRPTDLSDEMLEGVAGSMTVINTCWVCIVTTPICL